MQVTGRLNKFKTQSTKNGNQTNLLTVFQFDSTQLVNYLQNCENDFFKSN